MQLEVITVVAIVIMCLMETMVALVATNNHVSMPPWEMYTTTIGVVGGKFGNVRGKASIDKPHPPAPDTASFYWNH
ncbi:hypothetical protein VNO78_16215 [Psophocarpus tetragonolobus]|uniref:Transmembrane protein n=1 Tax=Psophocarpus tetragonolobus TaxID=3891 RepID=A0AAN9SHX6_PSOTE